MRLSLAVALALAFVLAPAPALGQAQMRPPLQGGAEIAAPILAEAGPGTRWGLVIADAAGREIVAIAPEERFMPASNTKLFTTAAALWAGARGAGPDEAASGARVRLVSLRRDAAPDVVLAGHGDARLSASAFCTTDCLAVLADAVAARTRRVHDVIGDAALFPDQRWSPGMSWNNMPTSSGTGIAALSIDDNEIVATVTPGAIGAAPAVALPGYYRIENHARTVPGDGETLGYDRAPGSRVLVVTGTIGVAGAPVRWRLGVDDPAHYAAWQLAALLRERGVSVSGAVRAQYRPLLPEDDPKARGGAPAARAPQPAALAQLTPPPLAEDIRIVNKTSQNLYAELLLRRLGRVTGSGSIADGQAVVQAMLAEAGVPPGAVTLADGSGMSSYNRVAPRSVVRLLGWIARQPWGETFRASLPIGGVDGTLRRRFAGTALAGRIIAKTGALNATHALAGWMTAASGRVLTFAIYANDVPEDVAATSIMDRALVALAMAN